MSSPQSIPVDIKYSEGQLVAQWIDIGRTSPELPFLSDRIAAAVAAGCLLTEKKLPRLSKGGSWPVHGLIFHAGRCGSTLVARTLAGIPACHVVSEPAVINRVLSVDDRWPFVAENFRNQTLGELVHAFASASRQGQRHLLFKLSSWNALHLTAFETVFPDAPLIFIYRAPEEIMVSLEASPPAWVRHFVNPIQAGLFLGLSPQKIPRSSLAFMACAIGKIMSSVAHSIGRLGHQRWKLVNYTELPAALFREIPSHLNLMLSPQEQQKLHSFLPTHAKDVGQVRLFTPDTQRKQAAVTPQIRSLVQEFIQEPYEHLEILRGLSK